MIRSVSRSEGKKSNQTKPNPESLTYPLSRISRSTAQDPWKGKKSQTMKNSNLPAPPAPPAAPTLKIKRNTEERKKNPWCGITRCKLQTTLKEKMGSFTSAVQLFSGGGTPGKKKWTRRVEKKKRELGAELRRRTRSGLGEIYRQKKQRKLAIREKRIQKRKEIKRKIKKKKSKKK